LPWRRRTAVTVLALMATVVTGVVLAVSSLTGTGSRPGDPFSGVRLFVDPHSSAVTAQASLARSDPAAAAVLGRIASQPAGIWLGSWIPAPQVAADVRTVLREAQASDSMPLLVLYAYPYQGCEQGTAATTGGYEQWIDRVAAGIGAGRAAVVLEPDALAEDVTLSCLSAAEQTARVAIIRHAVDRLAKLPHVALYLDAGNSRWQPAPVMASLLLAAGIRTARGFSVNVSNFYSTAAEEAYGDRIGTLLHGAHYVIDTSRNGLATAKTWCNPPGQALGAVPTVNTGRPLADALLWIKPPGVSDGACNGAPQAGVFWAAYALSLAANAHW
jgi:endoglucanase